MCGWATRRPAPTPGYDTVGACAPALTPVGVLLLRRRDRTDPAAAGVHLLPEFIDANTAIGQLLVERDRCVDGELDRIDEGLGPPPRRRSSTARRPPGRGRAGVVCRPS